ncbi:L7Ae/L30e/S12e/Gadd45 family ribosomal protein [Mycoplasma sp. P36-A1]|uniref:L7Ae/L30e/S12e/Gadd45 family ribosomal protein n=1 Tax=Mycoplasma sp. P36-A1 TaxID=3252900 RepID=UPI003C2F8221
MNHKNWLNALSLAQRAGKVVSGDRVLPTIRNKQAKLVLLATDASDNTKKKYHDKTTFYNIEIKELVDSQQLSIAVGKHNRMYLAITDKNFAEMILNKMKEE